MASRILCADDARAQFRYDPATGFLYWSVPPAAGKAPGGLAGTPVLSGPRKTYFSIMAGGRLHKRHILVWLMFSGEWPKPGFEVDHFDGDSTNDRFGNLREIPMAHNRQNLVRARIDNKSTGVLGVYRQGAKFCSSIQAFGKQTYLGTFETIAEASAAYIDARRRLQPGNTL